MAARDVDPMKPGKFHSADEILNVGRKHFRSFVSDKIYPTLEGEELQQYQAKRLHQEIDKFDVEAFKDYLNDPSKMKSLKSVSTSPEEYELQKKQLKQQLSQTGAGRSMWMGAACLSPMFREGLSGESFAMLLGVMGMMMMGYIAKTPDRIATKKIANEHKAEQRALLKRAKAKQFDDYANKLEAEIAQGKTSRRREFVLNNYIKPMRARYASQSGMRIGLSEEAVGIAGAALLVDANRNLMSATSDGEKQNILDDYNNSLKKLKEVAYEDGISPEDVDAHIKNVYAKVFYDAALENQGYYVRGQETLNPDFRTVETSIPKAARTETQSKAEVFVDFDEMGEAHFKKVDKDGNISSYDGTINPAPVVTPKVGCDAVSEIMDEITEEIGSYVDIPIVEHNIINATHGCYRPGVYVPYETYTEPKFMQNLIDISNVYAQVVVTNNEQENIYGEGDLNYDAIETDCIKPLYRQFILSRDKMVLKRGISEEEAEHVLKINFQELDDFIKGGCVLATGEVASPEDVINDLGELQQLIDGRKNILQISEDNMFAYSGLIGDEPIAQSLGNLHLDIAKIRNSSLRYPVMSQEQNCLTDAAQAALQLAAHDYIGRCAIELGCKDDEILDTNYSKYMINRTLHDTMDFEEILNANKSAISSASVTPFEVYPESSQWARAMESQVTFNDGQSVPVRSMMYDELAFTYNDIFGDDWDWYNLGFIDPEKQTEARADYSKYKGREKRESYHRENGEEIVRLNLDVSSENVSLDDDYSMEV